MIVQNLAVQRGQWLSFLCCYVVCEMEKTICPLPRLKFILNSIKNVHAPIKPQRVISAARGWEYFAKDYLWTVFPVVRCETHRLVQKRWESAKKFLFLEAKWNHVFFSKWFSKHSGKTRWWSFFVLGNADFFKFKNASELSWGEVLLIRVLYREQISVMADQSLWRILLR